MTTGTAASAPRLRFDRVALRLVEGVSHALQDDVPEGACLVFAVTAPIREPAKTMAALIEMLRPKLADRGDPAKLAQLMHGNQVRAQVMVNRSRPDAKIVGFVHNPEPSPDSLFDTVQRMLIDPDPPAPRVAALQQLCERLFDEAV